MQEEAQKKIWTLWDETINGRTVRMGWNKESGKIHYHDEITGWKKVPDITAKTETDALAAATEWAAKQAEAA